MIKRKLYTENVLFLCVLLLIASVDCRHHHDDEDDEDDGPLYTTPGMTTLNLEPTDIPQQDIDDALILDYGRYTTRSFHYERHQWMYARYAERCHEDYSRCMTSLIAPMPVCMFHTQWWAWGSKAVDTYCDAYFENCRLGFQYWRLIGYGECKLGFLILSHDEIIEV